MTKLMIVESPNKIKILNKLLKQAYPNDRWIVSATIGHFNDLDIGEGQEGVGVKDFSSFEPIWKIDKTKKKNIDNQKQLLKNNPEVWIATDPDREGEGIASQFIDHFKVKDYKRITFTELTLAKVKSAIENPRPLNKHWVDAWRVRRILDRLYGFRMSGPFKSFTNGKVTSIGRVQTPAVKLIVDRETEIINFKPKKYKTIEVILNDINFSLLKPSVDWVNLTKEEFEEHLNKLNSKSSIVKEVAESTVNVSPPIPLNTQNTLVLGTKLGFTADQTQNILQRLFEKAFITYIRTDSHILDKEWVDSQRKTLEAQYKDLIGTNDISKSKGSGNSQEGHEAIRPIDMSISSVEGSKEEKDMYESIYLHTLKCLLIPGIDKKKKVTLDNNGYIFIKAFTTTKELGWRNIDNKKLLNEEFDIERDKPIDIKLNITDKVTSPPSRFNEGKFISEMERRGIGRPSTFASTVKLIKDRNYIAIKNKVLVPTPSGAIASKLADEYLKDLASINYTSKLEEKLDAITKAKVDGKYSINLLKSFNDELTDIKNSVVQKTQEINLKKYGPCPKCGSTLLLREGKKNSFLGCSKYPSCKFNKEVN